MMEGRLLGKPIKVDMSKVFGEPPYTTLEQLRAVTQERDNAIKVILEAAEQLEIIQGRHNDCTWMGQFAKQLRISAVEVED